MMAGVEAPAQNGINPYQVGYAIFKNIYTHAGYGLKDFDTTFQPNRVIRHEDLNHRLNHEGFDEVAALKKVQEVRKYLNDVEFIRQYFTPEVAEQLGMVVTQEREEWDQDSHQRVKVRYVESNDFKQLKEMILQQYQNAFPAIRLVDANHNQNGEMLMKHDNPIQDLDLADTKETMATLNQFWGKPVHLDTIFEAEVGEKRAPRSSNPFWDEDRSGRNSQNTKAINERRPVRFSYHDGKMEIFLLKEDGQPGKNITDKYF
jgi:stage V sporulation protein R